MKDIMKFSTYSLAPIQVGKRNHQRIQSFSGSDLNIQKNTYTHQELEPLLLVLIEI